MELQDQFLKELRDLSEVSLIFIFLELNIFLACSKRKCISTPATTHQKLIPRSVKVKKNWIQLRGCLLVEKLKTSGKR